MNRNRTRRAIPALMVAVAATTAVFNPQVLVAWGDVGHVMAGKAAALALPDTMPLFFRQSADQLAYLNPEPDRWRSDVEAKVDPALRDAYNADHFINLERVPAAALLAPNRFAYLAELRKAGIEQPESAGMSPFAILELFQRLRAESRLWRGATDEKTRQWIEQRIINDAGILGHYVTDSANPLHTSIHHHGWVGENPNGYAVDKDTHARFEGRFVRARVTQADVSTRVERTPKLLAEPRAEILKYVQASHAQLEPLYQVDKRARFDEHTTAEENTRFTAERLAFGATMLRDLWWTAWITSEQSAAPAGPETGR